MRKWLPIMVLGLANFVMVVDGTVMNVSIMVVVADLDTTVSSMQLAIATFTLTMAALILAGAGLGARIGRRRTFVIGAIVYSVGSLMTALASGFGMLFVGWSLIEGIGAAMVIPSITALAAINYTGRDRAVAYALLGGVAGAAAAAGPLIGGWATTYLSWRWVFGAETIMIIALILPLSGKIKDLSTTTTTGRFDIPGVALSAVAMGTTVLALVSASTWGFIKPINPPFTVVGFSPTIPMVIVGFLLAWAFVEWERTAAARGWNPLVGTDLFGIGTLRAGLASQMILYFIIAGSFFVLPLYLQTVLGLDALQSGIRMLPLSVALFLMALIGSRLATRYPPRTLIRLGIIVACLGLLLLIGAITPDARGTLFAIAMTAIGVGVGLAISQIGNVNLSSVDNSRSSEAGGLQGTAQNLGQSLGVALAGTAVFIGLASSFSTAVSDNPDINATLQQEVVNATATGVPIVTVQQAEQALVQQGVPPEQAEEVVDDYAASKLQALRLGLGIVFLVGLVGLPLTRGLPRQTLTSAPQPEAG